MSTTKQRYPLSTFYPLQESVGYLGVLALPSNVVQFTLLAGVVRKVGVYCGQNFVYPEEGENHLLRALVPCRITRPRKQKSDA